MLAEQLSPCRIKRNHRRRRRIASGRAVFGYVGGNPLRYGDPFGLLHWTGDITYGEITVGYGHLGLYSYERAQLNLTACKDGKKITIHVIADQNHGPALNLPSTSFYGKVSLDDQQTEITEASGQNLVGTGNLTINSSGGIGVSTNGTVTVNGNQGTFSGNGEIVGAVQFTAPAQLGPYSSTVEPSN